jgi:hypothetical protein
MYLLASPLIFKDTHTFEYTGSVRKGNASIDMLVIAMEQQTAAQMDPGQDITDTTRPSLYEAHLNPPSHHQNLGIIVAPILSNKHI